MKLKKLCIFTSCFILTALLAAVAQAADFSAGSLISDAEITDYNSMDLSDIQRFLEKRDGTLENYITFDKEGNPKTAVQTFFETSRNWQISPKYLLVLVQKEQSLLDDPNPSQKQYDWATGYGVCDSCSMDDPNIQRFKGFYRQVNSAAAQTRYYMDNIKEFSFQPGKTYNIDGQTVAIKNTATAGLFNYTPHIHGNQLFWNLWNKYFGKSWPDGSLLQVEDSDQIYYIENGVKRLISSKAVFASRFNDSNILTVNQSDLDTYDNGAPIKYPNFSILQSTTTGNMYMIINDVKRRIVSDAVFKKLGFSEDDPIKVEESELQLYKDGSDITEYTIYPTGTLLQDNKAKTATAGIYYVISGEKKPVLTKEILTANFPGLTVKKVSGTELDNYMTGANVTLPDGWLVKLNPKALKVKTKANIAAASTVYVISHGKRLPIVSGAVFKQMGYNSKNIKIVSEDTLNAHELGPTVTGQQ
ncbi:MAG: hypothetical protein WCT16_01915 [Candidatus Buchananbacteria bacterium]